MVQLGDVKFENGSSTVDVLSNLLERLIVANESKPQNSAFLKFQSAYCPDVSVHAYLGRIQKYANCSDACLILAMVYIDRLIEAPNGLVLSRLNIHRLVITSVLMAVKFHDDLFYNNAYFAKLGGISLQELNMLEMQLFMTLNCNVSVSVECYEVYQAKLGQFAAAVVQQQQEQQQMMLAAAGALPMFNCWTNQQQQQPNSFVVGTGAPAVTSGLSIKVDQDMMLYGSGLQQLESPSSNTFRAPSTYSSNLDSPSSFMSVQSNAPSPSLVGPPMISGASFTSTTASCCANSCSNISHPVVIPVPASAPGAAVAPAYFHHTQKFVAIQQQQQQQQQPSVFQFRSPGDGQGSFYSGAGDMLQHQQQQQFLRRQHLQQQQMMIMQQQQCQRQRGFGCYNASSEARAVQMMLMGENRDNKVLG